MLFFILDRTVYSGKDGSVQRLFIQRWGVVAVFVAVVYPADTAPDDSFAAVTVTPCTSLIPCAALAAVQPI